MMKYSKGANAVIDAVVSTAQKEQLSSDDLVRGVMGALYSALVALDSDNSTLFDDSSGECLIVVTRYK